MFAHLTAFSVLPAAQAICSALLLSVLCHSASAEQTILLWPDDPALNAPDGMGTLKKQGMKTRVFDITTPHLVPSFVPNDGAPTPAVILCPGGAYKKVVTSESSPVVDYLNQHGVSTFTLLYRCPTDRNNPVAIEDLQRALRIVHTRAEEWNIDPDRIGVLGFSAGGNLCVRASLGFDTSAYEPADAIDEASIKPDFTTLVYPAYLSDKKGEAISQWISISADVAPTLIFCAKDDPHFPSSQVYEAALKEAGISTTAHYFEKGGHGFNKNGSEAKSLWPDLYLKWLIEHNIVRKAE